MWIHYTFTLDSYQKSNAKYFQKGKCTGHNFISKGSYKENRLVSMRNITILGDSIAVVLYIVRCDLVGGDVCSTDWSWLVEIRIYMYQMRMKKIYIYSFKDIAKVFVNGSDIYTHTWKTFKNPLYTTYRRFNMHILCSDLPALWYNSIYTLNS